MPLLYAQLTACVPPLAEEYCALYGIFLVKYTYRMLELVYRFRIENFEPPYCMMCRYHTVPYLRTYQVMGANQPKKRRNPRPVTP